MKKTMQLSFEKSENNRIAESQQLPEISLHDLPENCLRQRKMIFPQMSELQVVRHFTKLSQKNFSIDTHFYPLGSCTMKYNPRAAHKLAMLPGFLNCHPYTDAKTAQGFLQCIFELQEYLQEITGMTGVSLAPMAGAHGESAGCVMIKKYHQSRNDIHRTEMLVPDAAHGTNPASAAVVGFSVKEIPTTENGDVDLVALKQSVGPQTAGIMLTNPSTLGIFERQIESIAHIVHEAGGLLYYDGANLNAILGKIRPGDMGFDVMHLNLHKTFATPHGGGGPGAGPVLCNDRLKPFLPVPFVKKDNECRWTTVKDCPQSMGRITGFMGNAGVLLRAYIYIRLLGREGLRKVGEMATLNANYLMKQLTEAGYTPAFPDRRATHEFIITLKSLAKQKGVTALDIAKRLLDYGFHAPTIYFPLMVPECLLIEPTETECKEELDQLVNAFRAIREEIEKDPLSLKKAPTTLPVGRLDEVKAARDLNLIWESPAK